MVNADPRFEAAANLCDDGFVRPKFWLFFYHPMIAANCQNFGLFMGTRESQLQPNLR
jgi:hypothetical protein